ncbi:helix-turn-helix domain-containing protein [Paratractidigestivibacter sp.]|uniref:TetR/AcrR family transcriptional regulator n=1 Tax=Paratractidigestivibacter sp. TaxID=2847316 RepID=UPI002AC967B8|nr:helix-turn-helix domain-containing protein [Paratractidigestivibacter sp.]
MATSAKGTKRDGAAAAEKAIDLDALAPRDEAVVACAADVFLARPIAEVKMTDVAEAAGVGVATLYRRFSTKTDLAVLSATLLWRRFNEQIHTLVESDGFLALGGLERLEALLASYRDAYLAHAEFMRFLDELDHLLLAEGAGAARLAVYGAEVDSFYLIFDDAYLLGRMDGSITREVDFPVFYHALAHALTSVAQKLARGAVIPSDDFAAAGAAAELDVLINMAKCTLSNHV